MLFKTTAAFNGSTEVGPTNKTLPQQVFDDINLKVELPLERLHQLIQANMVSKFFVCLCVEIMQTNCIPYPESTEVALKKIENNQATIAK